MTGRIPALVRALGARVTRFMAEVPRMENVMKPCTCANTRRPGPCPRHGKLG